MDYVAPAYKLEYASDRPIWYGQPSTEMVKVWLADAPPLIEKSLLFKEWKHIDGGWTEVKR